MHEIAFYRYNIKSQELAKLKVFPMSPDALNLIKLKGRVFIQFSRSNTTKYKHSYMVKSKAKAQKFGILECNCEHSV
jgi:hypothetical protein